MAKGTPAVEIPADLRPVLLATAKNLLHHLYGPKGPAWGTRFADLEEMMVQLSDSLSSALLHQAPPASGPSNLVPEPFHNTAPSCGRPTQTRDPEPRCVQARIGTADWQEPTAHCEHCRKAFFPSVGEPGH